MLVFYRGFGYSPAARATGVFPMINGIACTFGAAVIWAAWYFDIVLP
jgi:hypothetical protein